MTDNKPPLRPYAPLNIPTFDTFFRPVDAPGSDPLDPNYVCVRFNEDWLPYVLGALARLEFEDTWKGNQAAQAEAIGHARNLIAIFAAATKSGCFEGVDDMRLRQKPGEPCVLQASYDGGDSWSDVFDYAACFEKINNDSPARIQSLINIYNDHRQYINSLNDVYNGNPDNILEATNALDSDPTTKRLALCYAVNLLVRVGADAAVRLRREQEQQNERDDRLIAALIGVAGAGVALFFPAFTFFTAGAIAVTGSVAGTGAAFVAGLIALNVDLFGIPTGALENEDAQDDVICYLLNALDGLQPTLTEFQSSLDSHTLTGDAGEIADVIAAAIQDFEIYLTFIHNMESGYRAIDGGAAYTCPCDDWQINRLNGEGNADLTAFLYAGYSDGTQCIATYDAVNDRYESCYSGGSRRASGTALRLDFTNPATVTGVTVRVTNQDNGSSNDMIQVHCYDALDQIVDTVNKPGDGDLVDATLDAPNTSYVLIYCRSYASSGTPDANIDEIILTGNGDSPF